MAPFLDLSRQGAWKIRSRLWDAYDGAEHFHGYTGAGVRQCCIKIYGGRALRIKIQG